MSRTVIFSFLNQCFRFGLLLFAFASAHASVLIDSGSQWAYLANGSNQGTAWRGLGFNDSSWPRGAAQLGYGDGDEATLIGFGSNANNKYITSYFRHSFTVADAGQVQALTLSLLRDDGAVVYVNGTEVVRSNMPGGSIGYTTLAAEQIGSPDERTYFSFSVDPALLVTGTNVIAVEVHQGDVDSSDLSFDLSLDATIGTPVEDTQAPTPPGGLTATAISENRIDLNWTASSDNGGGVVAGYRVYRDGAATPIATLTGTSYSDTGLTANTLYGYSVTAFDNAVPANESTAAITSATTLSGPAPVPSTLIATGSQWAYLANGSNQGTAWRGVGFNDSGWPRGAAQLGYGDGDEATVIGFGPNANNKYITSYFRHSFTVADAGQVQALTLSLLRDDGAVVYLNGTEVVRSNMPGGTIGYTTLAATAIGNPDEQTYFSFSVNPALLVTGTNVIAVEVHQGSVDSSDLSFDLGLEAEVSGSGSGGGDPVDTQAPTPPGGLTATAISENRIDLNWTASSDNGGGVVAGYHVYRDGAATPIATLTGTSYSDTGLTVNTLYSYSVTAFDNAVPANESTAAITSATTLSGPAPVPSTLIATGSQWAYLANGSNQGTAWRGVGFNDSSWPRGAAQLGYGDGDEATVIGFGSNANNKYITSYFRHSFTVADAGQVQALTLSLLRDDGAVVYVNGTEVVRSNMPGGTI
ncbi:MAG: fibronectin type III domain-containing protein, partial [Thiogranum sp.]|nr:fibronectin type III domain-containing protein [Thiogranum sp.]